MPIVHVTNDPADLHKDYADQTRHRRRRRLVLASSSRPVATSSGQRAEPTTGGGEIARSTIGAGSTRGRQGDDPGRPINPYRVIHEFSQTFRPNECIVTHDSGNPRGQLVPFYRCGGPRSFLGWGMSHGLGTSLG